MASLIALTVSFALAVPTVPGQALAAVTGAGSSDLAATETTLTAKEKKAQAAREKIAVASARLAYSRLTVKKYGTGTKYYLAICKRYMGKYYTTAAKRMQCNVPVSAAVRSSGVDKKFPTTNPDMYKYMKKSKKWKSLGNYNGKTSSLLPGDVLIRIKGVTTYKKNGVKRKSSDNHACIYVGSKVAKSVYSQYLKGTDADRGSVGSSRVFVNARKASAAPSQKRAACLETQKQVCADGRLVVFRYVG